MMKCQNCGFESAEKICSVCGAEIIETKEENTKKKQIILTDCAEKAEIAKTEKPKKSVRKILLLILIVVLSTAFVSASSIAVFYYCTNDETTKFYRMNHAVNCGDFSVTLKEIKTPEIKLEYYPQIVYDLVLEFHNNTGNTLTLESPEIIGMIKGECEGSGYFLCDNDFYKPNGKKDLSFSHEISAWSDFEIIVRVYYENYEDDIVLYDSDFDSLTSSVIGGADDPDDGNNSSEDNENVTDEENIDNEGIEIDEIKIRYKKEGLQRYKDNSPENFYLIISDKKSDSDEEDRYARFFVEIDKDVIEIPTGDNIE